MAPRPITSRNIFRVLIAGFALVILLLVAAAIVGLRNIQIIRAEASNLLKEQSVTNRLIDELHSQQTSLREVFSVLARDPESVDSAHILSQIDEADRDIGRISTRRGQHHFAKHFADSDFFDEDVVLGFVEIIDDLRHRIVFESRPLLPVSDFDATRRRSRRPRSDFALAFDEHLDNAPHHLSINLG